MNKKQIFITTLCVGLLSLIASPTNAYGDSAVTKGEVMFNKADTNPSPIDPTDPNVPPKEVEIDPNSPGTKGDLRFDRVPQFIFKDAPILGQDVYLPVKADKFKYKDSEVDFYTAPTVLITDARGTNDGWSVTLQASTFEPVNSEGKKIENLEGLHGAQILIKSAHAANYSGIKDERYKPDVRKDLVIEAKSIKENENSSSSAMVIAEAKENKGMGQWGLSYYTADENNQTGYPAKMTESSYDDAIQLKVPAVAKKKKGITYQSELTWMIVTDPS